MGRKKRRSSKFKDSSTVIDMDEAREERRQRQEKRNQEKRAKEEREQRKRARKAQTRSGRPVGADMENSGVTGERHDRRKMQLRRRQNQRRAIAALAAAVIVVVLGFSVGHIFVLKHDLHTAEVQQEKYEEEKAQLQKDMAEMDDLQNLEEQARDQMRLIKPGETLYIFPEDMTEE